MIDPIDLFLAHHLEQAGVQRLGGRQVGTERFFDHHPSEGLRGFLEQPGRAQPPGDLTEEARRGRQVEHRITGTAGGNLRGQRGVGRIVEKIALHITDVLRQPAPERGIQRLLRGLTALGGDLGAAEFFQLPGELGVGDCVVIDPDDMQAIVEQTVTTQVVQRRHQQTLDQITVGTEQEQRGRRGGLNLAFLAGSIHFFGVSTWPPKPKRIADSSLSP